jgi:hypothetical protein
MSTRALANARFALLCVSILAFVLVPSGSPNHFGGPVYPGHS